MELPIPLLAVGVVVLSYIIAYVLAKIKSAKVSIVETEKVPELDAMQTAHFMLVGRHEGVLLAGIIELIKEGYVDFKIEEFTKPIPRDLLTKAILALTGRELKPKNACIWVVKKSEQLPEYKKLMLDFIDELCSTAGKPAVCLEDIIDLSLLPIRRSLYMIKRPYRVVCRKYFNKIFNAVSNSYDGKQYYSRMYAGIANGLAILSLIVSVVNLFLFSKTATDTLLSMFSAMVSLALLFLGMFLMNSFTVWTEKGANLASRINGLFKYMASKEKLSGLTKEKFEELLPYALLLPNNELVSVAMKLGIDSRFLKDNALKYLYMLSYYLMNYSRTRHRRRGGISIKKIPNIFKL